MVLTTVGIPAEGVALIMGVDRILDMCRTAVNVAGDVSAAKLMDQWVEGGIARVEPESEEPSSADRRGIV